MNPIHSLTTDNNIQLAVFYSFNQAQAQALSKLFGILAANYVIPEKTGATSTVTYAQVKQVKGNNLSTAAEIAIGVGVILLPIAIIVLLVSKS